MQSDVLAMIDSVRLTVCPSVTRWYQVKMTQATFMRSSLQDSLMVKFSAKFQSEHNATITSEGAR